MDYKKIYDALIYRAQLRITTGYTEKHHIIPKCMDGTDDATNLVNLTAREHFVAHQLLIKIYPFNHKLIFAAAMMCASTNRLQRTTNRLYERLKILHAAAMSELHTGKVVSNETREKLRNKNRNYKPTAKTKAKISAAGKGKICSNETKAKISAANTGHHRGRGQPLSDEHKANLSIANTGRRLSNEHKSKLSAINLGKKLSDETKAKMSSSQLGRTISDEHKAKLSVAMKGKTFSIWITNGTNNLRISPTDVIPNGYYKGRIIAPRIKM